MLLSSKRLLLLSFVIANSFGVMPYVAAESDIVHAITPIDQIVNEGQRQLIKIRICLNSISALIKKNPSYTKEQQDAIVKHLVQLDRGIIENLRNEKFIQVDLENAYLLLQMNNALIDHINQIMNTNFKGIGSFNMEELIKKATSSRSTLKPEEIFKRLLSNNKKLDELSKRALGLTWYNKVSRTVDDYLITPTQKYSLIRRGVLALGTLYFGSYLLWQMNPNYFGELLYYKEPRKNPDGTLVRDPEHKIIYDIVDKEELTPFQQKLHAIGAFYGKPSYRGLEPEKAEGKTGQLENFVGRYLEGHTVIGSTLFPILSLAYLSEFKQALYPKIKKQFEVTKNWLKGGAYLKEAERAAEKVEQVRFKDIFGQDEIKRYMQLIVDYLEDPETFDRLGLTPPKGILCIGDTRTGKTFMINALFGEINDMLKRTSQTGKFKLIKLDVLSIKVDGMETILRRVRQNAPCIVFIDEIDLLDLQRTGENRTLSEFLTAMGEAVGSKDSKKQVIIIAATNRPETLDHALRQPGRFGKELRFEYPNYEDRCHFIEARLQELSLTSDQFDIAKLAQLTENKSYEAINMFIKNGIIKARLRSEILTQAHLEETLDEDIYHIIPKYTKNVPTEEMSVLAAHFAAQALMISKIPNNISLAKVTIKQVMTELKEEVMGMHLYTDKHKKEQQRFEYGRIFTHHINDSINLNTREEKLSLCTMYLAGFIGEELLLGSCGYSCHADDDMASALHLAQSIAFEGLDITTMPKHIQKQKHDEALAIIDQCKNTAREQLTRHKAQLQAISDALLEHKTLDRDQVAAIIKEQENKAVIPA